MNTDLQDAYQMSLEMVIFQLSLKFRCEKLWTSLGLTCVLDRSVFYVHFVFLFQSSFSFLLFCVFYVPSFPLKALLSVVNNNVTGCYQDFRILNDFLKNTCFLSIPIKSGQILELSTEIAVFQQFLWNLEGHGNRNSPLPSSYCQGNPAPKEPCFGRE